MSVVIAVANQKGGVGKTTTSLNLGHALAADGARNVLLVDFDPQASLTGALGFDLNQLPASVHDLVIDETDPPISPWNVIKKTSMEGVFLLPSNIELAAAETHLLHETAGEHSLKRVIDQVKGEYDFVLIDCHPSLGIFTTNGLTAADVVLVPVEASNLSLRALRAFLPTIQKVKRRVNPNLRMLGYVATKYEARTRHAAEVVEQLRNIFQDEVFQTVIPNSVKTRDADVQNQSVLTFDPTSSVAEAYRELAKEVDTRLFGTKVQALGASTNG